MQVEQDMEREAAWQRVVHIRWDRTTRQVGSMAAIAQ